MKNSTPEVQLAREYIKYEALGLGGKNGISSNLVKGEGPIPCKFMFIGEAPGAEEDVQKKPFIGPSGQKLNELLELSGLERKDVYVTNVFKYRPPNNRAPFIYEILKGHSLLSTEIRIVDPKYIILLGSTAVQILYPGNSVQFRRGSISTSESKRYIMCTYHPAIMLYNGQVKASEALRSDFEMLGRHIKGE